MSSDLTRSEKLAAKTDKVLRRAQIGTRRAFFYGKDATPRKPLLGARTGSTTDDSVYRRAERHDFFDRQKEAADKDREKAEIGKRMVLQIKTRQANIERRKGKPIAPVKVRDLGKAR